MSMYFRPRVISAIFGAFLTFVVTPYLAIVYQGFISQIRQDELDAMLMDEKESWHASGPCIHALAEVIPEQRRLSIGESTILEIVMNNSADSNCIANIEVNAAAFDVRPEKEKQFDIPPGRTVLLWNISPKSEGSHRILVSSGLEQITSGLIVKDKNGLSSFQLMVISILTSILGPAFTVPWWIEFLSKRREKREAKDANIKT